MKLLPLLSFTLLAVAFGVVIADTARQPSHCESVEQAFEACRSDKDCMIVSTDYREWLACRRQNHRVESTNMAE